MSVIGGMRSLWGALVGAAVVVVLGQMLQAVVPIVLPSARGDFQPFFLGVILIAILILLPRGHHQPPGRGAARVIAVALAVRARPASSSARSTR